MNKNIIKRLHHRPPYLLLDEILDMSSHHLHAVKTPRVHEFYLQGHFPGMPVVPGAMMQEMTTQAGGLLITEFYSPVPDYDSEVTKGYALGVLRSIHQAKYKKFARPDEVLNIRVSLIDHLESSFRFKGVIEVEGERIMTNEFTLINISEDQLKGT
jgi:3-hydroxyacyl-[acyl-carrier-protein] dehydratase